MSKNKLKFLLFFSFSLLFMFVNNNYVNAQDYNISINSLEGLTYGNKLKDVKINGNSEGVEGTFYFYNQEYVLDTVGEIELEIFFVAKNSSEVKSITVTKEVLPKKISVWFENPLYKQYDGLSTLNLPNYSYVGIINNEVSVEGTLIGNVTATYVGDAIPVVLSGVTIVGEKSDCYYLDLLEHNARIYPSVLEKNGENASKITLDKDVYVDISYSLNVKKDNGNELIDNKYTSFAKYSYEVYDYNNEKINVSGKYDILMKIDEDVMNKERLKVFELTKDGEYKELVYTYRNGEIHFKMDSTSSLVLSTRDIEYHFIILFSAILIFSLIFVIVYRLKNSKIKEYKEY